MPGMDGAQALARIRANWPSLRVLIASGQPGIEGLPAFTGPATAVIGKPFTMAEIRAKIAQQKS